MLKLQKSRLRDLGCAALVLFFSAFLTCQFIAIHHSVYAGDHETSDEEFFVTIYDSNTGGTLTVKTGPATVAEVFERSGIALAETDIVEPGLDSVISGDFHISINHARPVVIIDEPERHYLMASSYDPRKIALDAGITLYDGDEFTLEFNNNFLETGIASTYRLHRSGNQEVNFEESAPVSIEIPPERQQCADWAREAGVAEWELEPALELMFRESGCRVEAVNQWSGAYGIPQALPGDKMSVFGTDWQTNPITQIRWMANYVATRYGGWQQALDYWWCTGVCSSRLGTITKNSYWY